MLSRIPECRAVVGEAKLSVKEWYAEPLIQTVVFVVVVGITKTAESCQSKSECFLCTLAVFRKDLVAVKTHHCNLL